MKNQINTVPKLRRWSDVNL